VWRRQRAEGATRHDASMTTLGLIFPPDLPPERLRAVAVAADDAGVEQLWLWEDCFKESGVAPAAAVLAWTERLTVGIGLLPVPLRNVALTAMELATLERLFPGRVVPGVGHGVLDWMGQVGARAESPMTLLREHTTALQALLHGERVTTSGRYVHLDGVALDWPPSPAPPLLVGAMGDRTTALAGELGDGVIFSEMSADRVREALQHLRAGRQKAGRDGTGDVVDFLAVDALDARAVATQVQEMESAGATHVALHVLDGAIPLEDAARFVAQELRALVG
jgi:alkanesulfonate monooxygenase SsuD/methylene tetrahydromethanopterin reductase-like flavin-dependent oxidoreductase (luciferase family)